MPYRKDRFFARRTALRVGMACVAGACLLLAAGCAVGPDYRRPDTPVPSAYDALGTPAASRTSVATPGEANLVEWWKNFNDDVLTSLVRRAVQSNLDVRQAQARIRQARAQRGVVAAGLWPEVDANASYMRSRTSGSTGGSAGGGGTTFNLFQAGLDAAWELDFFGGTRRNVEASDADIRASEEDRRDVLVSLVGDVGTNYAALRGLQKQIEIARKNLEAQERTAGITRKRYEAGYVSVLDVANADALVASTQSQIPLLESSARGTIYTLSVLLGLEPAALADELAAASPIPPIPPEVPVGIPSDLLRRRPDIRRAEAQIHASTARIGVATADLFPKFSLTGSMGLSSSDLSSMGNLASRTWSFGPSVTWPIFAAGRIQANIEVQNALQEQALIGYQKAVLTAMKDVETALVAYAKEQEHRKALAVTVENYRKAVDLSMTLYVTGRVDFLNVLAAQRSLFTSEDALAQSTRNLATGLVALYKALGGGWENLP
ncbi:MAG: efflux transporter outer membrane subunit [Syntrophobacteraceae bacterium]|nr:efflux transporter outer membrane subunit [Desulfobacteraceae bacterium]